ncbi:hypothetical protein FM101_11730 [Arthrobacter rhombi]|uniref:Uncharacterized protein n=1 Tax=Arthrobacter rhombi TaxID=71253 RepID=A0A1R4GNA7_9MICC|nr:hypothetical protein FM101_11730 [Arthrobacter rhombi]
MPWWSQTAPQSTSRIPQSTINTPVMTDVVCSGSSNPCLLTIITLLFDVI